MNVGMLWFDNDPHTALKDKVARAADYYRRKYGRVPTLCLVHPLMLGNQTERNAEGGRPAVQPNRAILPGHLWLGEEDEN